MGTIRWRPKRAWKPLTFRTEKLCLSGYRGREKNWNLAGRQNMSFRESSALLSWESPSSFGQPSVIQTALFVPFSGTLPREVVLLTRRLPHQSEDWFAMTGNSPNSNLSVCCGKQIYKSIIFAGRRNSPGILLLYAMLFSLPGLLRAARRHSSVFHGLFSVSPTFT